MVYGKGSIFKENCYGTSLYQQAKESLEEAGLTIFELPDIDPNPRIESVYEGGKLCRDCKIDLVLAIGGEVPLIVRKLLRDRQSMKGIFGNVMKVRIRDRCKKSYPLLPF